MTAVCSFDVVAPPMSSGIVNCAALHLARHVHHLVERRRDQAGEADDVDVLLRRAVSRIFSAETITPRSMTS